jgi:hypothetical protein
VPGLCVAQFQLSLPDGAINKEVRGCCHALSLSLAHAPAQQDVRKKVMDRIQEDSECGKALAHGHSPQRRADMAPYYRHLCDTFHWPVDQELLAKMQVRRAVQAAQSALCIVCVCLLTCVGERRRATMRSSPRLRRRSKTQPRTTVSTLALCCMLAALNWTLSRRHGGPQRLAGEGRLLHANRCERMAAGATPGWI